MGESAKEKKYKAKLDPELVKRHYKQAHVQEAMLAISQGKEVVGSFGGTGYAQRPNMIMYPDDIMTQVEAGITSFHVSEETWQNPISLVPGMDTKEMDGIRTGWDLIIAIDCNHWEYSKIAAHLIIQALEHAGLTCVSCKFSGNHGFHIAVPFECFPEEINGKKVASLFPEAPKIIAEYLKDRIEPLQDVPENRKDDTSLSAQILRHEQDGQMVSEEETIQKIAEKTNLPFAELVMDKTTTKGETVKRFHALNILEIDTLLISSRHLVRHVYSINEKSGWVSVPINPSKVLDFNRDVAKIENFVKSRFIFLDRAKAKEGEATALFQQAYDFSKTHQQMILDDEKKKSSKRTYQEITSAVPEEFFPVPIQQILKGLEDGRKRAIFILKNFLYSLGWPPVAIQEYILEWNKKNKDPLKEVVIKGQLRSLGRGSRPILPPNYDNAAYYASMGIDTSEPLKRGIKNPVNDTLRRYYAVHGRPDEQKKGRTKLTEEQKEARKKYREKKKKAAREQKRRAIEKGEDADIIL
jgi:hypothetical protein